MSHDLLRECFTYNALTGELRWKVRPLSHFKCEHGCKSFNGKLAGELAGSEGTHFSTGKTYRMVELNGKTYRMVELNGKTLLAHRVIWILVHGVEPEQIDHINGDGTDNRLSNLQSVDRIANARNQRLRSDSTSGITGVMFDKSAKGLKKWRARINTEGFRESKRFNTLLDAACWRKSKEIEYGYHANHGEARAL